MKDTCPVFQHQSGGVRMTYHAGREQAYAVWTRAAGHDFLIRHFYATLAEAQTAVVETVR